jgi:type VI secretion system secreted protein Hcp
VRGPTQGYDLLVRVIERIGRPGRAALLLLIGVAAGGAALAVASVPDGGGVIHSCYEVPDPGQTIPLSSGPNLRIIDPSAGQACNTSEQPLSWNATSVSGQPGAPGPSGAQGPPGDGLTIESPDVKSTAHPVGEVDLGSGKQALDLDILKLSFASSSTRGGGGAGKVSVHDISITKKVDKSSPTFFRACVSGAHYKKVTITMRKAGGKQFIKYTMSDVIISSYQLIPSSGGGAPQESATLHFAKIEFS